MAKLINPVESTWGQVTPGERRFGRRLQTHLEDDYLCWYNVPLGPARQHPDFVILHPGRGILILEVKDWKLSTLRRLDKLSAELELESGARKTVPNPLEQARGYMFTVVDHLARDPQLCQTDDRFRGRLRFPYGYGVVLTEITRAQLNERLTEDEQEQVLPPRLVICKDEMTEAAEPLAFQEKLWGMFLHQFGSPMTLPDIQRVRWHLFPEIRIDAIQQDLFTPEVTARVAETSPAAEIPNLVRVMDIQQEQLARSLGTGHRVIHGVAGSGKTLILGYRCVHLARTAQKPILVLCFNITLAARLRSFIAERGVSDKVHVYHFHEWCRLQLQTYHIPIAAGPGQIFERQVASVIAAVDRNAIPRAQYEAVMIDEGHDFQPEWLRLVTQMIDPASDSLLLLYDDAQSIYKKSAGLDFSLSSVGIKAPGRTTILRLNYRNTREILDFAHAFARSFLPSQTTGDDDRIPLIEPESAGVSGPRPVFRLKAGLEEEIEFAAQCLRKWSGAGEPLQDMAVLCVRKDHCRLVHQRLEKEGLPCALLGSGAQKKSYDSGSASISILTAHSSKGLEFRCVIFLGLGHIDEKSNIGDPTKVLYVGMTRAREKLVLTGSASTPWVERIASLAA
jgi:hypothetical protein